VQGEPRFFMLQTIREYGVARLQECGEAERLGRRHALYYADLAEQLEREAWAIGPGAIFGRANSDRDNFRAALDWSQGHPGGTETALRLVSGLTSLWAFGGHSAEGYVRAEAVLARADVERYPHVWAGALITMGALNEMRGESEQAACQLRRSEEILRRLGDGARLSQAVNWLGITEISLGDAGAAQRSFAESRDLSRAEHLPWSEATALSFLAEGMAVHDDLDEVRAIAEESEARYRALRDPWGMARVQKLLAGIAWLEGDYAEAHRLCEAAIGPLRAVGERWNLSRTLMRMGVVQFDEGQYDGAEGMFLESLSIWHDLANDDGMILCLAGLAAVAAAQGQMDRARRLLTAEPLHDTDRKIVVDTISDREYRHLLDSVEERLRSELPARLPLGRVVRDVLEA
jgi:tetratricopeptide (TPR) repeat protein